MKSPISIKTPGFKSGIVSSPLSSKKKPKVLASTQPSKPLMKTIEVDDLPELILTKPPAPLTLKRPEKKVNGMF